MIITRKNAFGGRPISKFPIGVDPDTGYYGYKVGYCSCGCNNPLYFRTIDIGDIMSYFGVKQTNSKPINKRIKSYLIHILGGVVDKPS